MIMSAKNSLDILLKIKYILDIIFVVLLSGEKEQIEYISILHSYHYLILM